MRARALAAGVMLLAAAQITGPGVAQRQSGPRPALDSWLIGNQALLVDYYWFDLLQYFGGARLGEHGFEGFVPRGERLFSLGGDFPSAVIFASVVRATDLNDPRGALRWLERAEARNPGEWAFPYEQGFINYLWLGDYARAEADFRRAGRCPGAPGSWNHFVARIREKGGDLRLAIEMWEEVAAASEHAALRESAMRNVERLTALLESQAKSGI